MFWIWRSLLPESLRRFDDVISEDSPRSAIVANFCWDLKCGRITIADVAYRRRRDSDKHIRTLRRKQRNAMRSVYKLFLLCLILAALIILLNVTTNFSGNDQTHASRERLVLRKKASTASATNEVTICVVVCGDRLHEALTMLKSALVFASRPLQFVILAEHQLIPAFSEKLSEWKLISNKTFDFLVRPITFPDGSDVAMWKKLFKPCAAQRLFLPVSHGTSW